MHKLVSRPSTNDNNSNNDKESDREDDSGDDDDKDNDGGGTKHSDDKEVVFIGCTETKDWKCIQNWWQSQGRQIDPNMYTPYNGYGR